MTIKSKKTGKPQFNVLIAVFMIALFVTSCGPKRYLAGDFEQTTVDHKRVAVLPFKIVFTGRLPKDLSEQDLEKIKLNESETFQASFAYEVHRSARKASKKLRIDLQPHGKTRSILEEKGIGILEAWEMDPEQLIEVLDVDAVVIGRIEKNKIMSDLASLGIDLGTDLLRQIPLGENGIFIPTRSKNNKFVAGDFALIGKGGHRTLWSTTYDLQADWQTSNEELIQRINRRSARAFPYRYKKQ